MWAKYAIYEAIDKIPGICRDMDSCGAKWSITGLSGETLNYMYI
jgi:hypothetical protein